MGISLKQQQTEDHTGGKNMRRYDCSNIIMPIGLIDREYKT